MASKFGNNPRDRPPAILGGATSVHFGPAKAPSLLLPIIPPKKQANGKKRGRK
jgi:hypothetical protein